MVQYTAGQRIRGSEINALPQLYRVQTPQICNNSAVLRDVVGLSFSGEANGWYLVECFLAYHALTTGDIKFAFSAPTAVNGDAPGLYLGSWWTANGIIPNDKTLNPGSVILPAVAQGLLDASVQLTPSIAHARSGDNAVPVVACPVAYLLLNTAGTVKLQFAQNSAVVHDTTIRAGSCMRVSRLA